jgi:iron complex transport system permease protein
VIPISPPRRRLSRPVVLVGAVVAIVVAAVLSVCVGGMPTSPVEVFTALFAPTGTDADVAITGLRVPRTVLGIVVGACLGLAGTLVQGHTRNPIADPGLLGIFQGAALAIVLVAATGDPSGPVQALFSFIGALGASALVFAIAASARGGATPITLVLAGVAVSALFGALVTATVLMNLDALDALRFWQVGSLATRNGALAYMWPFVVVGAALALANGPALNALALGPQAAASLGVSLRRARVLGIAAITLLAGAAVMLAGPIAFAGLIVPHIARALVGADYRWQLPASALIGSAVLLVADTIARVIAQPGELSVSVVLAVAGAPFFIALARRGRVVSL